MNENCLDIGTIQAYLDGEASPEISFELTGHAAVCDDCALLLAQAEDEHSQVYSILERELNSMVPTQRLWTNISSAISEDKAPVSLWGRIRMLSSGLFANPSLAAAAGVLMFTGLFLAIWSIGEREAPDLARGAAVPAVVISQPVKAADPGAPGNGAVSETADATPARIRIRETNHSPEKLRRLISNADLRRDTPPRAEYLVDAYLPGEESYVRTIANLKQSVDGRKDLAMTPSSRIAFERDLAVVNDAIDKMKELVKKDPRNQAAKQVLYSSYQNKIDLLNSVVEREELMASLQ